MVRDQVGEVVGKKRVPLWTYRQKKWLKILN